MTRWFLVRHGETDWNSEGRAQGQTDTPLNGRGRSQADSLAKRLTSVSFDAAYASDLTRVTDTAKPIISDRSVSLKTLPELREKSYGDWDGMTYLDVESQYPELFKRLFDDDFTFAPPNGESDTDLYNRVNVVAKKLKAAHTTDENVLVVAHGGTLRVFAISLLGMPLEYMWRFRLSNGSLSIISVYHEQGNATIDLWNDESHLEEIIE